MNINWFRDTENVVYAKEDEVLPRLSRELGIPDLARRVAEFRANPDAGGINVKGLKRTTLKLFIPDLVFGERLDMGENVWVYMGELCPAYCLYTPWDQGGTE